MKCVCRRKCLLRIDGKGLFFNRGEVSEFEECPNNFAPLEGPNADSVDFLTASEEELMEAKWKISDASLAIKDEFDIKLKSGKGYKKLDLVKQILDARYRKVD